MIVIADDITGAAEMAGIAFCQGQQVRLLCVGSSLTTHLSPLTSPITTVIATDTRSMTEAEAIAETRRIASLLSPLTSYLLPLTTHLYKKTDSALRGHVVAELSALMETTGYRRAVYLPANPSKGRVIRGGIYYIKEERGERREERGKRREEREIPIHETAFSYDPEFPATTSVLKERFPDAQQKGIIMPDAESKEDIRRIIAEYNDGKTLFAGAADLFEGIIGEDSLSSLLSPLSSTSHLSPLTSKRSTIFLCGSTQSKPLDIGLPVTAMPRTIYDGSKDITLWEEEAAMLYDQHGSLMISIPFRHRTGKEVAVHLREMTATLIGRLVKRRQPQQLILEGGASAFATLQHLGWHELEMVCQLAPGVIKTKAPNGTFVIMKPGSYSWGTLF